MGKSIILGDIVPANLISEVNGNSVKTNPPTSVTLKEEKEDKGEIKKGTSNETVACGN